MSGDERTVEGWFTLADAARFFGVTAEGFRKHVRPHIPDGAISSEGRGRITWVHGPDVLRGWLAHRLETSADPDASLQREKQRVQLLREGVKLQREQLQLLRERADTVSLEEFKQRFGPVAQRLRRAGEVLKRRFGNDAARTLNEALDECAELMRKDDGPE